jgi:hypothetical protein
MDNNKIPTRAGVIVILIMAITAGAFVWKWEKNQPVANQAQQIVQTKKMAAQSSEANQQSRNQQEIKQPITPSLKDEANKSPEQIVKDFYEWYIGNIDYRYYLVYKIHSDKDLIDLKTLIRRSPFISAEYEKNMEKRMGMYDAVLCTNDNEFNAVKECGKAQINGNSAEVNIFRGYAQNENTTRIQIMLKKEGQWKIDDIICDFKKG